MVKIVAGSGPDLLPKLIELVELTKDIKNDGSTTGLEAKMDELIHAIEQITER